MDRTLGEFWALIRNIRSRLGGKGYLLDQYLSMLLEGVDATHLFTAAEQGYHDADQLHHLCRLAMDGKHDPEEHPLSETVREYIQAHPLPW